ncbi:uncharacterized protein IL334_000739 [Kwoniella shivajii]|uniref:ubiquitinyl hydrolase 1 n=1 Tax=Kwoniella shivajii TaxID=564305 RepID=A0ABZ1CRH6_9TREE|nr:hypothetical protein IL334_000739 [Kwoniella shivajii]
MPTSSALPPPSNSSQPPTPYQPQTDPSNSPSTSNNPPPQPPPSMPTFASINSGSYPSTMISGPSYLGPNNHYMYQQQQQQQQYYPPQPPRHAQAHNLPYNSSALYNNHNINRFQDQSYNSHQHQHQTHFAPIYHQQSYGGYPAISMNGGGGGGGPGPATMQNGYGGGASGYQVEAYQHIPYGAYSQQYPVPPEPYQQYPTHSGSNEEGEGIGGPQQLPVPPITHIPPNFPTHDLGINGHALPPLPHQSFHPAYPPNHPYAYGVGVGYPGYQPQQQPMTYGGYGGYQEGYIPPTSVSSSSSRSFGKSLNPAAAGFSFTPSSAPGSRANSQPSFTPLPNDNPRNSASEQSSEPTSANSNNREPPTQQTIPNGHAEYSENSHIDTNISFGDEAGDISSHSGLGLTTQLDTSVSSSAPSTNPNQSSSTTNGTASTAATTASSPVSLRTPKAPEADLPTLTSPKSLQTQQEGFNFVGEGLAGLTSPTPGVTARSISIPSTGSSSSNGKKRASRSYSTPVGPLRLFSYRPDHVQESGNTYSASARKCIPKSVRIEDVRVEDEKKTRKSNRGKPEPSKKKAILIVGDQNKKYLQPRGSRGDHKFIFGEADPLDLDIPAAANLVKASEPEIPSPMPETKVSTPQPEPSVPQQKAKPFSWASLVRGPAASSSSTPSKLPSPAKSTISLPAQESKAGPSRLPVSDVSPTSPSSVTGTLTSPPPVEKKKAPFNYAAAAAAGAAMSPQEELAKLLSEGVKGKGKETGQATVPRGLINTGNMCFANTILQVLVYCSPFTELFEELGKRLKADLARKTPLLEAMIIFLREFNAPFPPPSAPVFNGSLPNGSGTPKGKGKDPRREAFIPENVYDAMKENKRFDSMRRGHQEDAEEYLGFFLNTLHEELLYVLSRTQTTRHVSNSSTNGDSEHRQIERPVSPGAGDDSGWLEVGKKQKTHVVRATESKESAVSRLFGGTIRSLLKTPGSKDSVTLEPFQPLQLDIQSPSVLNIEDALKHLTEPETVGGVWSSTRNMQVEATKQMYIEQFPQVWILHLKRFVYDPTEHSVVKRNKAVGYGIDLAVPPEIISPGRRGAGTIKYRLFGVVYHHGASASGGHYTVAVSRQDGAGWIHFDDENVTNIPKEDVIVSKEEAESGKMGLIGGREKTAYLLFYQRIR